MIEILIKKLSIGKKKHLKQKKKKKKGLWQADIKLQQALTIINLRGRSDFPDVWKSEFSRCLKKFQQYAPMMFSQPKIF